MLCSRLIIRESHAGDSDAIALIERDAFGRDAEAEMALALIASPPHTISLVAECNGRIIGHVLTTEIRAPVRAAAIAPLAVLPEFREMQVGSQLIREAIHRSRSEGFEALFVLGDNAYYERFGFNSHMADPFDIDWQGPNFMALELRDGALSGNGGRLEYPQQFFAL
ncbi:MAG: N-acetyltransferase [Rhizobiaceae bacterium]